MDLQKLSSGKKIYKLWAPFLGLWCFYSKQELILHATATVFMNIKESPDLDMDKIRNHFNNFHL